MQNINKDFAILRVFTMGMWNYSDSVLFSFHLHSLPKSCDFLPTSTAPTNKFYVDIYCIFGSSEHTFTNKCGKKTHFINIWNYSDRVWFLFFLGGGGHFIRTLLQINSM